jgi:galactose-6-phosphate isomerase
MRIAVGCDHIVTPIKNQIITFIKKLGHEVIDAGTYNDTRTHYDIYGFEVARLVVQGEAQLGVVICGTGVGISNSANKVKGARTVLTREVSIAVAARKYYNANILAMGGRITGLGLIEEIVKAFLNTKYEGLNKKVIESINKAVKNDNYNVHQFDNEIKAWEKGEYTDGEKQDKIPLPKT